jgi:hypothetical protein
MRKAIFAVTAAPIVVATAIRVARLGRGRAIGPLVAEIRRQPVRPLPSRLAHPEWLAGTVELLLAILPPFDYGPCLRRALLLLDLWSRCGLDPRIHLGFRPGLPQLDGHAWLTAGTPDGGLLQSSGPGGRLEIVVL